MPSAIETQLRSAMAGFLAGRLAYPDFAEQVAIASWELEPGVDPGAEAVLAPLELVFAEHALGHRGLDEVRSRVRALSQSFVIATAPEPTAQQRSSSAWMGITRLDLVA
jgi:hypothetical protein